MTAGGGRGVVSVEDGGLSEALIEPAGEAAGPMDNWDEWCPTCEIEAWLRLVAAYRGGAYWAVFCSGCGKVCQERWNLL